MTAIGFLGLGNMGRPMAANLVKGGLAIQGFDPVPAMRAAFAELGGRAPATASEALGGAAIVISMLPAGPQLRAAYLEPGGVLDLAAPGALLIDCSTVDVESARAVAAAAAARGFAMLDAPVSGGSGGAAAGTLTFMVGGPAAALEQARPILQQMGKTIIHCGAAGTGQAAKICNNLILGVTMTAVSEAFILAEALGLDAQKLFDVSAKSSGQCWALTSYCPVPGPVPTSPANRDYQPGFTADMMLKDLRLAEQSALATGAELRLAAAAAELYRGLSAAGAGGKDFSFMVRYLAQRLAQDAVI